jgi:ATP-binding protein involved in chromosome partitioning
MKAGAVTRVPVPHAITRLDEGLRVEWDERGHTWLYPARELRLACPCAECIEEMSGRPLLDPGAVPADVRPVSIGLVGAYGLRVVWSDGHSTGIYTFEGLRRDCGCPLCRAGRSR